MANTIGIAVLDKQLQAVDEFIKWLEKQPEADKLTGFKQAINIRREWKRQRYALSLQPAIAAFGESQKGKSYMISSLLSNPGEDKKFKIRDGEGKLYDFIEEINPKTTNTEATGVVSRFTGRRYESPDPHYPFKVNLLSFADIAIIISDSYYNVKDYEPVEKEVIDRKIDELLTAEPAGAPLAFLRPDDIYDIHDYLEKHLKSQTDQLRKSTFFDTVALHIDRLTEANLSAVMSLLWAENKLFTDLFDLLTAGLKAARFAPEIYVPIDALLNEHGTIISVECLNVLIREEPVNQAYVRETRIYMPDTGECIDFDKSVLCALTREIVFNIPDEYIDDERTYVLTQDDDEYRIRTDAGSYLRAEYDPATRENRITLTKGLLKYSGDERSLSSDLLDFPGARSRSKDNIRDLTDRSMPECFRRGKVSYLFNKYSDELLINILLFCHDNANAENGVGMPDILSNWIRKYIGEDIHIRTARINESVISPFFIIATKYNIDLAYNNEKPGQELGKRWHDRFVKVLSTELIKPEQPSHSWFERWVRKNDRDLPFDNIYLLRDFKYSSDSQNIGTPSNIFHGYPGPETTEIKPAPYPGFRDDLKTSFLHFDFVRRHVATPSLIWDNASTLNNDGTLMIIKNLTVASNNANKTRLKKFSDDNAALLDRLDKLMNDYYVNEDKEILLTQAIEQAGRTISILDLITSDDEFFWGRFIRHLQIHEVFVFDEIHKLIAQARKRTLNKQEYLKIINRCKESGKPLSSVTTDDEKLGILQEVYKFQSKDSVKIYFTDTLEIDLDILFRENWAAFKPFSVQLTEFIYKSWTDVLQSDESKAFFERNGVRNELANSLIRNIIGKLEHVYTELGLPETVGDKISRYVDELSIPNTVIPLVSDIIAEGFNRFIATIGYDYMTEQKKADIRRICSERKISIFPEEESDEPIEGITDKRLLGLFNRVGNQTSGVFEKKYFLWTQKLYFSFIAGCELPKENFNFEANRKLGNIISGLKQ